MSPSGRVVGTHFGWSILASTLLTCGGGEAQPTPGEASRTGRAATSPSIAADKIHAFASAGSMASAQTPHAAAAVGPVSAPTDPRPAADADPLPIRPPARAPDLVTQRDPFVPVPLAAVNARSTAHGMRLIGVIRGRALLALVEDADGVGHIVEPGSVLDGRRVVRIADDAITLAVDARAGQPAGTITLVLNAR